MMVAECKRVLLYCGYNYIESKVLWNFLLYLQIAISNAPRGLSAFCSPSGSPMRIISRNRRTPIAMRILSIAVAVAFLSSLLRGASAQEDPVAAGWAKCDSEIEWNSDERKVRDNAQGRTLAKSKVDVDELFEKAKAAAKESGKLILWYIPEVQGSHMYRPVILDNYMKAAIWTDEAVVDLVKRRYVPLRAAAAGTLAGDVGVKRWEIVEPAIVVMDAEGKRLHAMQRIRTFNADHILTMLRLCAGKFGNSFESKDPAELIKAGEYERAMKIIEGAATAPESLYQVGVISRRLHLGAEALAALDQAAQGGSDELKHAAAVERGLVHLAMARLDAAEKELASDAARKGPRAAEAEYHLALVERRSGRENAAQRRWESLAKESARTRWGWRASANLLKHKDTVAVGPAPMLFEDPIWTAESAYGLAVTTRWERTPADLDDIARRAAAWLVRAQTSSGAWTDTRYAYWPSPEILPNVRMAATSMAAAALLRWQPEASARWGGALCASIERAVAAAEKFIADDANVAEGKNEEVYAQAFRLTFLVERLQNVRREEAMETLGPLNKALESAVKRLAAIQDAKGFWAHEYPNPFCTAAALGALRKARAAKHAVDDAVISRGCDALMSTRGERGRQAYGGRGGPSPAKDSSCRSAMCEAVLLAEKRAESASFEEAVSDFFTYLGKQENVRVCDFHSDGELGGFFFWHGFYHTVEALDLLEPAKRAERRQAAREHLAKIAEIDGSFLDSHEMGKSYGTAMALMSLNAALRK